MAKKIIIIIIIIRVFDAVLMLTAAAVYLNNKTFDSFGNYKVGSQYFYAIHDEDGSIASYMSIVYDDGQYSDSCFDTCYIETYETIFDENEDAIIEEATLRIIAK